MSLLPGLNHGCKCGFDVQPGNSGMNKMSFAALGIRLLILTCHESCTLDHSGHYLEFPHTSQQIKHQGFVNGNKKWDPIRGC